MLSLHTHSLHLTLGSPHSSIHLSGMSNSEFTTDSDGRISVSGYCFSFGSGIISWSSWKQSCLTLSSCEAEYVATCNASCKATWLCTLLSLLEFPQPQLSLISIDNQGTLDVLYNPSSHACTKHFDSLFYCPSLHHIDMSLTFIWIPSYKMVADIFTKRLPQPAHTQITHLLGLS
jgi:hypothetical protein